MKRAMSMSILIAAVVPAVAIAHQHRDEGAADYDRCVMSAAVQASYSPATDEQIVDIARSMCVETRTRALVGGAEQRAMLDAVDARNAANLADWIGTLRDRRRTRDAVYGAPEIALR